MLLFGANFISNIGEEVAMVLFGIGFANLLFQKNLIKKIIGLNIMDSSVYLFLAEKGYIEGRLAPIVVYRLHRLRKTPETLRFRGILRYSTIHTKCILKYIIIICQSVITR